MSLCERMCEKMQKFYDLTREQLIGLAAAIAALAILVIAFPSPGAPARKETEPTRAPLQITPLVTPQPTATAPSSQQPSQSHEYLYVVLEGQKGAWSPEGKKELDIAGRRYNIVEQRGRWMRITLDDGVTTLWLEVR